MVYPTLGQGPVLRLDNQIDLQRSLAIAWLSASLNRGLEDTVTQRLLCTAVSSSLGTKYIQRICAVVNHGVVLGNGITKLGLNGKCTPD
jgi:hypothetical protein